MTPDTLIAAVGCTKERAEALAVPLGEAMGAYSITGPVRMAAFLAQVGHESGSFRWMAEIWGPTDAQRRYEGRQDLGNTEPGDGQRFKGRGLIQTTGRDNYRTLTRRLADRLGEVPDFVSHPELLVQPRWACWSACDFWARTGCNELADAGDFEALTRRINGGLNGLADRMRRWEKAKAVLTLLTDQSAEPIDTSVKRVESLTSNRQEKPMLPAIIGAVLPSLVTAIPDLVKIFGSDAKVTEKNAAAATAVADVVVKATQSANLQEATEKITANPEAAAVARDAVKEIWFDLIEVGGGFEGARKADTAFIQSGGKVWQSPSFWAAVGLLPLAYMVVGSVIGLWGGDWPPDVRAAIGTAVVSLVIGAISGYYFGAMTSRNRTTT